MKALSSLDFKLGLRMLIKYPWLTVVGGLGMAVAVAIGASFFGVIYSMMDPSLPLPDGNRIVSIQNWDNGAEDRPERRIVHDYFLWRKELTTIQDVGIFRNLSRNIIAPYGETRVQLVAEMTASGFRVAGVKPLLGRHLADSDEQKGASNVAVIGYDIWKERFGGDRRAVGRTVQIGSVQYQIVGVMPKGYAWPLNNKAWIPMRATADDYAPRKGPAAYGFGKLARNATLQDAEKELAAISKRIATAYSATHARLEVNVLPYTYPFFDIDNLTTVYAFHAMQMSITLLLVLVCANVATLIYARTAAREGEITVRTALGANRLRIVSQLFAEALVLAAVASVIGITIAKWALRQIQIYMQDNYPTQLPFWLDIDVSFGVILYVVGLTFLGAMIIGALPAARATSKRFGARLRELSGASGMRMGRTWTFLIIAQVAFAVAILPTTLYYAFEFSKFSSGGPGFPADEYVTAIIGMESQAPPSADAAAYWRAHTARYNERQRELVKRIAGEPGVADVTVALAYPGEEPMAMLEIEGKPRPAEPVDYSLNGGTRYGYGARANRVYSNFFTAFDIALINGRYFGAGDADSTTSPAIVNQDFVRRYLQDGNIVGRKFRYVGRGGDTDSVNVPFNRWYTIIAVVENFPPREMDPGSIQARVYHLPLSHTTYNSYYVRTVASAPPTLSTRIRHIAAEVDPTLQVSAINNLQEIMRSNQRLMRLSAIALVTLTASVLLLSAAGIYSLMSLTVQQRRREIGVRSALGGNPRRIVGSVFRRAARQLVTGVTVGIVAAFVLDKALSGILLAGHGAVILPAVAALMLTVGLIAAYGPARRGLAIQPTEALRDI